jgi:DNA-directed RNA polymerase subunit H (RpoH/RPB5)
MVVNNMEDRALDTLRLMLGRRNLDTKTERLTPEGLEKANAYTIGKILVLFAQKDKGLQERDINALVVFGKNAGYDNGMVIVSLSPPSDNVLRFVKGLSRQRVQFFHIRQLQFDITTHRYAMPHRILKEDEKVDLLKRYHVSDPEEVLPSIDSQDPMVKWIGGAPGDVIEVLRHSDVAGSVPYYRYCVEDANVQ